MENEILEQTTGDRLPAQQTPMDLIRLAVESNADPEKLGQLMALAERFEDREASKDYAKALAAFQLECPQIKKNNDVSMGGRRAYGFASLDYIMRIIQPILSKHGLSVQFSTEITDQYIKAQCKVRCGVHVETTESSVPVPTDMKQINKAQQGGAAIKYATRYALIAALNLQTTDDDLDAMMPAETITELEAIVLQDIASELDGVTHQKCLARLKIGTWVELPKIKYADVKSGLAGMVKDKNGGGK